MVKKIKQAEEVKIERPPRAKLSANEALKRMKDFNSARRSSLPLSARVRIELFLPDLPKQAYQDLLTALDLEFTYTFGGCTIIQDLTAATYPSLASGCATG